MKFLRIVTSNGEERWINLAQVARVSLSAEASSGCRALIVTFVGGERLTIHGSQPVDEEAIAQVIAALEDVAMHHSVAAAA